MELFPWTEFHFVTAQFDIFIELRDAMHKAVPPGQTAHHPQVAGSPGGGGASPPTTALSPEQHRRTMELLSTPEFSSAELKSMCGDLFEILRRHGPLAGQDLRHWKRRIETMVAAMEGGLAMGPAGGLSGTVAGNNGGQGFVTMEDIFGGPGPPAGVAPGPPAGVAPPRGGATPAGGPGGPGMAPRELHFDETPSAGGGAVHHPAHHPVHHHGVVHSPAAHHPHGVLHSPAHHPVVHSPVHHLPVHHGGVTHAAAWDAGVHHPGQAPGQHPPHSPGHPAPHAGTLAQHAAHHPQHHSPMQPARTVLQHPHHAFVQHHPQHHSPVLHRATTCSPQLHSPPGTPGASDAAPAAPQAAQQGAGGDQQPPAEQLPGPPPSSALSANQQVANVASTPTNQFSPLAQAIDPANSQRSLDQMKFKPMTVAKNVDFGALLHHADNTIPAGRSSYVHSDLGTTEGSFLDVVSQKRGRGSCGPPYANFSLYGKYISGGEMERYWGPR